MFDRRLLGPILTACLAALPVAAAPPTSSVQGKVVDRAGNPVEGVELQFSTPSNPKNVYTIKSDKKGRYFLDGLFSGKDSDPWIVKVTKPGMVPVQITIESRTVNRILLGDIQTKKLGPGASLPGIDIRPLGTATVDLTLATEAEAAQEAQQAGETAAAATDKPAATKDPLADAVARVTAGDLEGAVPLFEKAIEQQPGDAERREAFAKVLYQLHRYPEAEREAQKAVELAPAQPGPRLVLYGIAYSQGDKPKALAILEQAREAAPSSVDVLKQLGFLAAELGDAAKAISAYEAIVAIDAQNAEAWRALGDLYARGKQAQKSEQAYQKATALAESPEAYFNLGALIMNRKEVSEADTRRAIDAFRKAVTLKPDYPEAQRQLGYALVRVGDLSGARGALEAYLRLRPDAKDASDVRSMVAALPK